MTEREAQENGFYFTGACWSIWEKEREVKYKAEAAALKKKYIGVDYRIVAGSARGWLGSSSKAIYGNEAYSKVQYYRDDTLQIKLNNLESRKQKLLAEIAEIEKDEEDAKQLDAEIKSLLK